MKRIALTIAAVAAAAFIAPMYAQTTTERIQAVEESLASCQNSMDSICTALSGMQEEFEAKASLLSDIDGKLSAQEDSNNRIKSRMAIQYSEIAMKWVCLLIFAIFLPLLLVRLYNNKSKEDQRRYDVIIDLIRSGVEIKPEMQDFLTGGSSGTGTRGKTIRNGAFSGLTQSDIDYCAKRILWAVCFLVIGITIASISNEGVVFAIFACISAIFAAQAVVRYFSLKYYNEHKAKENNTDAE